MARQSKTRRRTVNQGEDLNGRRRRKNVYEVARQSLGTAAREQDDKTRHGEGRPIETRIRKEPQCKTRRWARQSRRGTPTQG